MRRLIYAACNRHTTSKFFCINLFIYWLVFSAGILLIIDLQYPTMYPSKWLRDVAGIYWNVTDKLWPGPGGSWLCHTELSLIDPKLIESLLWWPCIFIYLYLYNLLSNYCFIFLHFVCRILYWLYWIYSLISNIMISMILSWFLRTFLKITLENTQKKRKWKLPKKEKEIKKKSVMPPAKRIF